MLDVLSGGRPTSARGGYQRYEFERFGLEPIRRAALGGRVDILMKASKGSRSATKASSTSSGDLDLPKPVQKPTPPMWVTAQSPYSSKRRCGGGSRAHRGFAACPSSG